MAVSVRFVSVKKESALEDLPLQAFPSGRGRVFKKGTQGVVRREEVSLPSELQAERNSALQTGTAEALETPFGFRCPGEDRALAPSRRAEDR